MGKIDEISAASDCTDEELVSTDQVNAILASKSHFEVWREYRGLTQSVLVLWKSISLIFFVDRKGKTIQDHRRFISDC